MINLNKYLKDEEIENRVSKVEKYFGKIPIGHIDLDVSIDNSFLKSLYMRIVKSSGIHTIGLGAVYFAGYIDGKRAERKRKDRNGV